MYGNEENNAIANFLTNHKDGQVILSNSKNSIDLESLVVDYHKSKEYLIGNSKMTRMRVLIW